MKKILVLVLILPLQVFAKGMVCEPDPHESQMMLTWTDKEVSLIVVNPMGIDFMPQLESTSASMIPFLKMQSDDLTKLDSRFEYHWPRANCEFNNDDESVMSCQGSAKSVGSENGIEALGFSTAKLQEQSVSDTQTTYRVRMIFNKNNTYFVTVPFPMTFCHRTENK